MWLPHAFHLCAFICPILSCPITTHLGYVSPCALLSFVRSSLLLGVPCFSKFPGNFPWVSLYFWSSDLSLDFCLFHWFGLDCKLSLMCWFWPTLKINSLYRLYKAPDVLNTLNVKSNPTGPWFRLSAVWIVWIFGTTTKGWYRIRRQRRSKKEPLLTWAEMEKMFLTPILLRKNLEKIQRLTLYFLRGGMKGRENNAPKREEAGAAVHQGVQRYLQKWDFK